ncbi:MAG: cysteine--tRNA ligase, partial [Planctomycetes bacterium]|nr:cysteine--tRNA ligase [Planctomycetota bacterium]
DLNTSEALAVLHELMTTVNRTGAGAKEAVAFLWDADRVFAILDEPEEAPDAEIDRLMADREAARKARDFKRSDAIRDELLQRGIEILDTPQGTRWRRK